MSRYYDGWAPYVPVAKRRRQAARQIEKLRKKGHPVAPVIIQGRTIATTFWARRGATTWRATTTMRTVCREGAAMCATV